MNDDEPHPRQWAPTRAEVALMTDRAIVNEQISTCAEQQIVIETLLQWKTDYTTEKRNGMIGALIRWRIAAKDLKNRFNQILAEEGRAKSEKARLLRGDPAPEG